MSTGNSLITAIIREENRAALRMVNPQHLLNTTPNNKRSERQFFDFVRTHVTNHRVFPSADICLAQNYDYRTSDNQPVSYYLDRFRTRAMFNLATQFKREMTPLLAEHRMDDVFDLLIQLKNNMSMVRIAETVRTIADIADEILQDAEDSIYTDGLQAVPFGYPSLDRVTGGMVGGDSHYIVARPGVGKSNVLAHCAAHAWRAGFRPLLLTMEMSDIQYARRVIAQEAGLRPSMISRKQLDVFAIEQLREAKQRFEQAHDFYMVNGEMKQTVSNIASLIQQLEPDCVYLDASYLIDVGYSANKKTWEKIEEVGNELKFVALNCNVPILQTVQFNREAASKKKFELENAAGSDNIARIASTFVALTKKEGEEDVRYADLKKNREGEDNIGFKINFKFSPPDFSEIESSEDSLIDEYEI